MHYKDWDQDLIWYPGLFKIVEDMFFASYKPVLHLQMTYEDAVKQRDLMDEGDTYVNYQVIPDNNDHFLNGYGVLQHR